MVQRLKRVSLITLLHAGAADTPEKPLVVTSGRSFSYKECLDRSEAFAHGLLDRSIDRFACVLADAADILPLLCASTAVGAEACVYPAAIDDAVVDDYALTFAHDFVVSDRPLDLIEAETVRIEDLSETGPDLATWEGPTRALILTTGTTGKPRGVRHDWARLVSATRVTEDHPNARWLLAYNLNQFAGMQILLHVLVNRATLVVPQTNQPRDALAAMRELGVTHASATPTFWRLFTALIDPPAARDLSLRQITLGGEAVPGAVLDSIARLFPDAKVSQIYAGNEFGSVGSVRDRRGGLPISALDRGEDADVRVRIVDGELQVRSRFGMLGYFGEPDIEDGWLPTGDVVRVEDDRIVFMGRTSETINVGGVKVHPLPVEEAAGRIEGVQLVHAYGRPSPVTGQIVALDVVVRPGEDIARVEADIRAACNSLLPAARPRRIRFVDQIDTRGHKVARSNDPR